MQKDSRRFFTPAQKREILTAFQNKCQGKHCSNRDLESQPVEFHHIVSHAEFGLTERTNCIPLCLPCHRQYTAEKRVEQVGSQWTRLRKWQQDAIDRYVECDERCFVLEAAPGAGKSLFAATVASYEINQQSLDISHVICVAPWTPILTSLKKSFSAYKLDCRDKFNYDSAKGVYQRLPNCDVIVDTYQGFCRQLTIDTLERWKASQHYAFRFMLILDEIHHTNTRSGKWGTYLSPIAELADKIVVMSGTYFRNDNSPISFLKYEDGKPRTHYSISYAVCVKERYTRQVSFRYHDPVIEIYRSKKKDTQRKKLSRIPKSSAKMTSAAKAEVLNPDGLHVEAMIKEAWSELKAMRRKWSDAACLVVCRTGNDGTEERAIHAVSQKIKTITGKTVDTVTSDDAASRGKIDAFVNGDDPFICAIRMVSEGVDIPRVRMVLLLSYTDSEMLFRQIVGRCTRYIEGKEDDTAALVIMPKFAAMTEFAERFESEAKQGAIDLEPKIKGNGSGVDVGGGFCEACKKTPCRCYVVLGSEVTADGGQIASSYVPERYIQVAKIIQDTSSAHQHCNPVQLGDALQKGESIKSGPIKMDLSEVRDGTWRSIIRQMNQIAKYFYGGDRAAAWRKELIDRHNCDASEFKATRRTEELQLFSENLRVRLLEGLKHD